ncbi:GNAT family N-acetyltransferase [Agromyces soli]|uniref:GNAT family N-acetyltransferase n=1 Tax=Agromyces soli TaxID=659012 RepID=A0ABY4AQP5_9MICO|nr:GNAT family N-acetyltransferase [Agromyces soli]UOE25497.1 GNAT family N-acetyltransferase [Agromyces soli]
MSFTIRAAGGSDFAATEQIERDADQLFVDRFEARDWPPPTSAAARAGAPGFTLVAAASESDASAHVLGFAQVLEIAGQAHLEQLSVRPTEGRRGVGGSLIDAAADEAKARGYSALTLRTYADVPWNGPFYLRHGFRETEPTTDFELSLLAIEAALGLNAYGRRTQMTRRL